MRQTKIKEFFPWHTEGLALWKELKGDSIRIITTVQTQYRNTEKYITKVYYEETE